MDLGFKNIVLKDDETSGGGVAFMEETLGDFYDTDEELQSKSLTEVNRDLRICGIQPLFEKERQEMMCLVAYYVGNMDHEGLCDRLMAMKSIVDKVNDYEFVADRDGLISTDDAYDNAYRIATSIYDDAVEMNELKKEIK